jgi:hypothetical protein
MVIVDIDYIDVVTQVKKESRIRHLADLAEAFDDVRQYEQGTKKLKSAKELLNEL